MAFFNGNDWNKPSQKQGFLFEKKVFDLLRSKLPATYGIQHSAIVHARPDYAARGGKSGRPPQRPGQRNDRKPPPRPRPREVDFLVAGPNGLFLIEAKSQNVIRGSIFGHWAFSLNDLQGAKLAEQSSGERYGLKMKENMMAAYERVAKKRDRKLEGFKHTAGIFVFQDEARVDIYDADRKGPGPTGFPDNLHVAKLSELPALIERLRPSAMLGQEPATVDDVRNLLDIFEPGLRLDPNISGDYTILDFGSSRTADNGLPYAVCKLRHNSLGYVRRGKWYDMAGIGDKDRQLFEEQIRRHAKVLNAANGHRNINRYYEYITDLVGSGYWVIEEWIDGASLHSALRAPGAHAIQPVRVMREIAEGLSAIHAGGYVCRNLGPGSILIEYESQRPVLTNFEMAKASDGGPTVSAGEDLPDDPYRAPETRVAGSSSDTDVRADVYSWGAIFFRVATGQEPALQPEIGALEKAGLPAGVVDLVKRCLSPMKSQRPATIAAVLEQLEGAL